MDNTLVQVLMVCAVFAVIFGPLTARSSHIKQPIQGGTGAKVFHLIACMTFVSTLPGVIAALILGGGVLMAFPLALSLTVLSLLSLMVYAYFEQQQTQG